MTSRAAGIRTDRSVVRAGDANPIVGAYLSVGRAEAISDGNLAMSDALVEVFADPEYVLNDVHRSTHGRKSQRRVAACKTDPTGKFCFAKIPPGEYELRVSSGDRRAGWNVSQVYVVIQPHSTTHPIEAKMLPAI